MPRTNLTAEGAFQQALLTYIEDNASDALVEKINAGEKKIKDCAGYIINEARKRSTNNCAVMADDEVYGLAIHYFEEDEIKPYKGSYGSVSVDAPEKAERTAKNERKPEGKVNDHPKTETAKKGALEGQTSIFDMLGG